MRVREPVRSRAGYSGTRTRRLTAHNVVEGHGPGRLIAPLAVCSARKGADDFGRAIKRAIEAS